VHRHGKTRSMSMIPDKNLIKLRFEQAAATYEQQAMVQHLVADRLLTLLTDAAPAFSPLRVLEIGCCTGLLTEKIMGRFPAVARLTVSDLVAAFEPCVCRKIGGRRSDLTFLAGDIESVDLPDTYDLIISSSTLHWVHNLSALCRKLHAHLNPGGILAFSQYGVDNLREIRAVTGVGLEYQEIVALKKAVAEKFDLLVVEEARETLWFTDPISVLQHLRATGVNSIGQQVWTRKQVSVFIADYIDRFSGEQGVSLTYHPIFMVARPQ